MEIILDKTDIKFRREIFSSSTSAEEMSDYVVPDALPDIGRIADVCGGVRIRGKEAASGSVRIDSAVAVTVLYVPEGESALLRSVRISEAVQSLVAGLGVTPAFVIAKGGITSSDVGTKALRVRRAEVMGQLLPGVPVWRTGQESRFPGTPYVIFPGNVGEDSSLREAVEILTGA